MNLARGGLTAFDHVEDHVTTGQGFGPASIALGGSFIFALLVGENRESLAAVLGDPHQPPTESPVGGKNDVPVVGPGQTRAGVRIAERDRRPAPKGHFLDAAILTERDPLAVRGKHGGSGTVSSPQDSWFELVGVADV